MFYACLVCFVQCVGNQEGLGFKVEHECLLLIIFATYVHIANGVGHNMTQPLPEL
jgi:hypothetical protein